MNSHINARTTPYARARMVARREAGVPVCEIAAAFEVSQRTVFKWLARFKAEGEAGLANRSSRPRRSPRAVAARYREAALLMRRTFRMTGEAIAEALRLSRSSVARWLAEAGLSRLARLGPAEPVRRYQRERPGELIHIDIKTLGRFARPGHRVTRGRAGNRNTGAGWDFVHVAIDDATRLAYAEAPPDERRASAAGFLVRALRWYRQQGVGVERVMSDNGSAYVSKRFARTVRRLGLRHIRTRALHAENERQGRALPPVHAARMGLRRMSPGRAGLRPVLFMAALSAARRHDTLSPFYRRLIENGKPKRLALAAVARKIAVIANAKIRDLEAHSQLT